MMVSSTSNMRHQPIGSQTYRIITQYGDILIVKQGVQQPATPAAQQQQQQQQYCPAPGGGQSPAAAPEPQQQAQTQARPVIMTFHDLGLNSELQFATFCECDEVKLMLQTFTIIHVNFIGQEFVGPGQAAAALPDDFRYPTVEQMAECIVDICAQMRVRSFVALAVGAGAHIVSSLALLRPDLVHGLFLINPVVSSCSITEWLYFKMSAIASNHQIGGSHHQHQQPGADHDKHANQTSPNCHQQRQGEPAAGQENATSPKHRQQSGLRKLLSAAARLPHFSHHNHHHHQQQHHHQHHQHQHQHQQQHQHQHQEPTGSQSAKQSIDSDDTALSVSTSSVGTSAAGKPASSRLRQLILSRHFRHQHHELTRAGSSSQATSGAEHEHGQRRHRPASAHEPGAEYGEPAAPSARQPGAGKRPPIEYLMYHHFGGVTFQRYRRPLAEAAPGGACGERGEPSDAQQRARRASDELASRQSSPSGSLIRRRQDRSGSSSRSQDSLAQAMGGGGGAAARYQRRSNSVCLSVSYLASLTSDRQRAAYVQNVYKQYFAQINAHNLWLFAQSFVKRRTLNLRKDCGAAAHAAAAAAALGTSICAAFVGVAPAGPPGAGPLEPGAEQRQPAPGAVEPAPGSSQPQALVAGTKVKRTFTCQTLIMCSSVQIHCERAIKLMSLLNPLQATWIKTGQLLVLEEKPEKVCQALRLFLQGIGYSMSTYERRLRLSSAQGSVSSADSTSSARSINDKPAAGGVGGGGGAT